MSSAFGLLLPIFELCNNYANKSWKIHNVDVIGRHQHKKFLGHFFLGRCTRTLLYFKQKLSHFTLPVVRRLHVCLLHKRLEKIKFIIGKSVNGANAIDIAKENSVSKNIFAQVRRAEPALLVGPNARGN